MKKQILSLVVLSTLAYSENFYGGVDLGVGSGTHSLEVDGTEIAESDSLSTSSFGLHVGYKLTENGSIEASYQALSLEDDDATTFGIDYIHSFGQRGSIKPYVGLGLSTNSLDDSTIETGLGARLRGGIYYELMPKLDIGAELNYNYISWETETDYLGRDWTLSSSYFGLGLNLNYTF
jgi:outer membrane protein assembly factor BamA